MTATARIAASECAGGCPHTCRAFRDLNLEGGRGAKLPGVAQRPRVEAKMRQVTVILVTAVLTVMVTVFSMMAKSSNSVRTSAEVRAPDPIDVMKITRDAKDLPNQSYPAH
jgi:hypothetical protein